MDDYDIMYKFLDNYEKIRDVVKAEVEAIRHGNQDFKNIGSVIKKYDKEVSIEINMPVQNQRQIKVDYVDGKTVGILDF